MSQYKCINPFYSEKMTKRYSYGDKITSDHYYNLMPCEQRHFVQDYDDDGRISSGSNYNNSSGDSSWLLNSDISSSIDLSSSSDSSSSDSGFDFGGGDGGGAGASGDW